jgi:hypothetical protein
MLEALKASGKLRSAASRILVIADHSKALDLIYAFLEHNEEVTSFLNFAKFF